MDPATFDRLAPLLSPLFAGVLSLPDPVLERIGRGVPEAGVGLAPDQKALIAIAAANSVDENAMPVADQRTVFEGNCRMASTGRFDGKLEITECEVAGAEGHLRARLYRSLGPEAGPAPLLVWFHGGGWVVGSIASHDLALRRIAAGSGSNVLSVDYRLAPEHPWPAAPDDVLASWRDVVSRPEEFGSGEGLVMVGGDSAGGNLATVLCRDLRLAGEPQPLRQILIYPACDLANKSASCLEFGEGFVLTDPRMDFFKDAYVPDHDSRTDPRISPLLEADLSGLAPAWIATALADPLRDEGEAYGRRLSEAGVETRVDRYPAIHGWMNVTVSPTSRKGHASIAASASSTPEASLDTILDGGGIRII